MSGMATATARSRRGPVLLGLVLAAVGLEIVLALPALVDRVDVLAAEWELRGVAERYWDQRLQRDPYALRSFLDIDSPEASVVADLPRSEQILAYSIEETVVDGDEGATSVRYRWVCRHPACATMDPREDVETFRWRRRFDTWWMIYPGSDRSTDAALSFAAPHHRRRSALP